MARLPSSLKYLLLVSMLVLVLNGHALAYVDPGTGSYVLQLIVAGLLGLAFAIKGFWRSIRAFCLRLFSKRK